jgi:hypothetical protein
MPFPFQALGQPSTAPRPLPAGTPPIIPSEIKLIDIAGIKRLRRSENDLAILPNRPRPSFPAENVSPGLPLITPEARFAAA